ncbi:predicted dehydrogenase [Chthonomonas calidirosea]|uniref:Predicted dehydrogenases and related proteins n=1 Tax=Chthonomonas calidirosea (strain DSM 23976 / ICMP 18418 / T49) TaxID=1303518 RepID=S0EV23_CHTCT|nr:Gfo/Idh/MocA family oxidoreductase [Chthonomonas calidirosea]CCW35561.1 Predicted dehydrogenases and related proteins [Chthonomonas calidirosea T49]CEK19906.1 predicted dehydrogenase [Chthonomonas calidirosea]
MTLKVAVIGAGGIGARHGQVYMRHPDAELLGYCDIDAARADRLAARDGVKSWHSVKEMLADVGDKLQAVSVCTAGPENGGHHYEPTMQCFEAGLHVLCEKPISNNIHHAREMVETARKKGLYFGINLNHRFTPPAAKAKEWVQSGKLGHLLLMNMTMWIDNPNESSPWFHIRALHPHSLDIMRYYCGPVRKVHAFFNRAPKSDGPGGKRVCWSNVQVNLLFENDVVGHLTGSYDANPAHNLERCEVMGTEGRFVLENLYEELTFYPRRSPELTVIRNSIMGGMTGFDQTFDRRIGRWIEQVNAGVPRDQIEASGEDGLAVQEIIEAAIQSWENNCVVDVERG